jgi:hypothetical protein
LCAPVSQYCSPLLSSIHDEITLANSSQHRFDAAISCAASSPSRSRSAMLNGRRVSAQEVMSCKAPS